MDLLHESAVSIDECFTSRSEPLTYPNQMIFIYLGHCANYGGFLKFYNVMRVLFDFTLDYAPYVVVRCIQVLKGRRPYVWDGLIVEITNPPFLNCLGLKRLRSLVTRCTVFLCPRSLTRASYPSVTSCYSQQNSSLIPEEKVISFIQRHQYHHTCS